MHQIFDALESLVVKWNVRRVVIDDSLDGLKARDFATRMRKRSATMVFANYHRQQPGIERSWVEGVQCYSVNGTEFLDQLHARVPLGSGVGSW